jgi:hypothetical protein
MGRSTVNENCDLGTWETGNTATRKKLYDGEPTESDVVDNVSGSIGFTDRSFGGKFVTAGRKKSSMTSANKTTMMVKAATAAAKAAAAAATAMKRAPTAMNMAEAKKRAMATAMEKVTATAMATTTAAAAMRKRTQTGAETPAITEMAATTAATMVESNRTKGDWKRKEEDRKMSPEEFVMEEKKMLERARRAFGIEKPKTLASMLASGELNGQGSSKLTLLSRTKATKQLEQKEMKEGMKSGTRSWKRLNWQRRRREQRQEQEL